MTVSGMFVGRADRLDLVARLLRDRPGITAPELARDLGVSVRSVFRDLGVLRDRGYPVEAARGRGGGLRLRGNWGLGRVLLARDEALCTLLGLAIAEHAGLPVFGAEIARARRRIADAFPAAERRRIAPLRERVAVGGPASAAVRASYGTTASAPMRALQAAFVDERVVEVDYEKGDGTRGARRVEPHVLLVNWPAWYLLAWDVAREARRTLRLDRIVGVRPLPAQFRPRPAEMLAELAAGGVAVQRL